MCYAEVCSDTHTLEYRRTHGTITYPAHDFARFVTVGVSYWRGCWHPVALRCHPSDQLVTRLFRHPRDTTGNVALTELLEQAHALECQLLGRQRFGARVSYDVAIALAAADRVAVPADRLMYLIKRRPQ